MCLAKLLDETGADGADEHVLHEVEVDVGVGFGEEARSVWEREANVGIAEGWEIGLGYVDVIFLLNGNNCEHV